MSYLSKIPMDVKKKRLVIGIGLSIVAYFLIKNVVLNYYKKKGVVQTSNFLGANGQSDTFVAKRFDASHINSDGSKGATWISYNNSDVVGYWEKGKIEIGEPVYQLI
jgi:hypothetical protein